MMLVTRDIETKEFLFSEFEDGCGVEVEEEGVFAFPEKIYFPCFRNNEGEDFKPYNIYDACRVDKFANASFFIYKDDVDEFISMMSKADSDFVRCAIVERRYDKIFD